MSLPNLLILIFALGSSTVFARNSQCEKYLTEIQTISEEIDQHIRVNDDVTIAAPLVRYSRALQNVIEEMDPRLGPLKRPRKPFFFIHDQKNFMGRCLFNNSIEFNTFRLAKYGLSPSDFEVLAAHEIGHAIFDDNLGGRRRFAQLRKTTWQFGPMLSPYHELFAGMSVLFATRGDPSAEANLVKKAYPKLWRAFRWDLSVPLDQVVPAGQKLPNRFFTAVRFYLWENYFKNAPSEDYPLLMQTFIRAAEIHMNQRIARDELEMKSYSRRAPLLNREFVEIFDEEFKRARNVFPSINDR